MHWETMTNRTDAIPVHTELTAWGEKEQRRPLKSSHVVWASLWEEGIPGDHKAASAPRQAFQGSINWSLKLRLICKVSPGQREGGSKGLERSTCPGHSGNFEESAKQWGKKTEGEQHQIRQGLGSHVGEFELKKNQEEEWEYGLCFFPFT